MPDEAHSTPPADDQISRRIQSLLMEWVSANLPADAPDDLVERALEERRAHVGVDVDALAQRVRGEVVADLHRLAREAAVVESEPEGQRFFVRLPLALRLQHFVLLSSCIILILTGLPIKFHDTAWAAFMFDLMGGIQSSALIHRIGAVGLIAVGLVHLAYLVLTFGGRLDFLNLIPGPKDARDLVQMIRYFLGRTDERPRFGRFSYVEKFDYWAVYWGTVIMVGTGAMLWFENLSLSILPKYMLDIAKEAHSDEALLATLAIIIWHFYNVHFSPRTFPMNKVWLTGRISEEDMIEEHPLEYERLIREQENSGGDNA